MNTLDILMCIALYVAAVASAMILVALCIVIAALVLGIPVALAFGALWLVFHQWLHLF